MPKALKVDRAPSGESSTITLRRDGKPDLQLEGTLLLTVETEPVRFLSGSGPVALRVKRQRWKKYSLYLTADSKHSLIVAEEGHSSADDEVTRYSATICRAGADAWIAMGAIEELKKDFAEIGFPAVERFGGGS